MKAAILALPLVALAGACTTAYDAPTAQVAVSPPVAQADTVQAETAQQVTQRLNTWFDAKFEEALAFSPIQQTYLGRKTDYGKIDDASLAAEDRYLAWMREATAEMQANFDRADLTPEGKISWDMWLYNLSSMEAGVPYRANRFVLHQFNGTQSFYPTFLINQHRVESESDMVAFISRLRETGRALDQALAQSQANAAAGTRPPRFAYEGVIDQSRKITTGAPFDDGEASALWTATQEKIDGLVDSGADRPRARRCLAGRCAQCAHRNAPAGLWPDHRVVRKRYRQYQRAARRRVRASQWRGVLRLPPEPDDDDRTDGGRDPRHRPQ